jgi:hypothetical protein
MPVDEEWPERRPERRPEDMQQKMREMIVKLYERQEPEQKLKKVKKGVSIDPLAPPPGNAYSGRIDIF